MIYDWNVDSWLPTLTATRRSTWVASWLDEVVPYVGRIDWSGLPLGWLVR